MTDKKPAQTPDFMPALGALIARHQLTEQQAAGLLGVPVSTLRKWTTGQRAPNAAAVRLVEVLDLVGALAPALMAGLIPEPVAVVPVKRGRPSRAVKASNQTTN
jgi:transcriptional regulator with XRE-family HTH domain